jgi:hypothetical protein
MQGGRCGGLPACEQERAVHGLQALASASVSPPARLPPFQSEGLWRAASVLQFRSPRSPALSLPRPPRPSRPRRPAPAAPARGRRLVRRRVLRQQDSGGVARRGAGARGLGGRRQGRHGGAQGALPAVPRCGAGLEPRRRAPGGLHARVYYPRPRRRRGGTGEAARRAAAAAPAAAAAGQPRRRRRRPRAGRRRHGGPVCRHQQGRRRDGGPAEGHR